MSVEAARRLILAHRPELAESELRRWLALHPGDAHAHALLGWSLALRKLPGAVEEAEEAVRLAPEWAYTHAALGEVHVQLGHHWRAELPLRRALALEPGNPQHHVLLALSLVNQRGRFRDLEALRLANEGLALDPGHAACARMRALALLALHRTAEAREAADFALRLEPESPHGHAIAGWAHLAGRGGRRRARALLREALRVDPGNEHAQQGLRKAEEMLRFSAAILLEAEESPAWLRAAAALFVLAVAATIPWGHDADTLGALVLALCTLLAVDVWTLRVRLTARGRARMRELRLPGALTRTERLATRAFMVAMIAIANLFALSASMHEPLERTGDPQVWHLPWNH